MQKSRVGTSSLETSRIAYGCWRLAGTWNPAEIGPDATDIARRAIVAAIESGITLFDHADIYCQGAAETLFGKILKDIPGMRRQILIATKCGIRAKDTPSTGAPYRYDFRKEYIVRSCESSLQRLGVDVIDLYQLHRPDYLMDPMEVAEAFTLLREQGKVREFGVSNFRPSQVEALQASLGFSLQVNQVEISLFQLGPLENGVLDQCLTRGMSPMAWSPLGGGKLADGSTRVLPSQQGYSSERLLSLMDTMAREKSVSRAVIALSWLLKHPSEILPIVGSLQPERIQTVAASNPDLLSHEEWYQLLAAARAEPLP